MTTQHHLSEMEAAYEKSLWHTNAILAMEESRIYHLNLVLSEYDKDILWRKLDHSKRELDRVEKKCSGMDQRLQHMHDDMRSLQVSHQSRSRELNDALVEASSLRVSSPSITQLQTQNQDLKDQLSSIKPEINRLRSQNVSYQSVVSENLSLRRQLSSLELELQEEKRLLERMRKKHADGEHRDSKVVHIGRSRRLPKLDSTISTPGMNRTSNLPQRMLTLPGDKSSFSTTPFFNRHRAYDHSISDTLNEGSDDISTHESHVPESRDPNEVELTPIEQRSGERNCEEDIGMNTQCARDEGVSMSFMYTETQNATDFSKGKRQLPPAELGHAKPERKGIARPNNQIPRLDPNIGSQDAENWRKKGRSRGSAIEPERQRSGVRQKRVLGGIQALNTATFSPLKRVMRGT